MDAKRGLIPRESRVFLGTEQESNLEISGKMGIVIILLKLLFCPF